MTVVFDADSLSFDDLVVECLDARGQESLRELVAERVDRWPGIVVARGLGLDRGASPARRFAALCRTIGELVPQHPDGPDVREVRDRGARIAEGATARYSDSRFGGSLHTDGAESAPPLPRYVVLACIRPAAQGGELQLVSAEAIHARLTERSPAAASTLHRPFHFDRRGVVGPRGERTVAKPVFWHEGGRLCVTYLRGYIERGHEHPDLPPLVASQIAALDEMDALLADPRMVVAGVLRAGDVVVLDNRAVLHGRTTFVDAPGVPGRLLLRAWLR